MPLRGPDAEDARKLHAEVNQIVNQRFTLTTIAITVFGGLSTLMTHDWSQDVTAGPPHYFVISSLLSVILFVLFFWSYMLTNTLRTFTIYLEESGRSGWEEDWSAFRRAGSYSAYSKPQAIMFLIINALGILFAFLTHFSILHREDDASAMLAVFLFVTTESSIFALSFRDGRLMDIFIRESEIRNRWKQLSTDGNDNSSR